MARGRVTGYVGNKYGLVTVRQHFGRRLLCECECGGMKYLHAANIATNPPKTHRTCQFEFQFELALDGTRT
jgi:hypothetical protein